VNANDLSKQKIVSAAIKNQATYSYQILNTIIEPIFVKNEEHSFVLVNDAFCTFTGIERSKLLGKNDLDFFSKEEVEVFWKQDDLVLKTGLESLNEEQLTLANGEFRNMVTKKSRLLQPDGGRYIVGIIRDITEITKTQQQIAAVQKMEAVGKLAGGIAHDFNNILTVIKTLTELSLMEVKPGDPIRKDLEQIREAGERGGLLIKQLLTFSRRQVISPKQINLSEDISKMSDFLQKVLGENVKLNLSLPKNLDSILFDPAQLEQIIINLVVNAKDVLPQNGGVVTLETANVTIDETFCEQHHPCHPGSYVLLSISDNGAGMTEEIKAKIFEPFFTTKPPGQGTGLGLSMVYGAIKQSHGFIWVDSKPQQGTTFRIYLPSILSTDSIDDLQKPPTTVAKQKKTILVVEDEAHLRAIVRRILEGNGYEVITAKDGVEAIKLCKEAEPLFDLLLSDMVLPGINGKELGEKIFTLIPTIKILYMSGHTDKIMLDQSSLKKNEYFISKPFSTLELSALVKKILENDL
jgi:PAS domain S-box-containing protein